MEKYKTMETDEFIEDQEPIVICAYMRCKRHVREYSKYCGHHQNRYIGPRERVRIKKNIERIRATNYSTMVHREFRKREIIMQTLRSSKKVNLKKLLS